MKRTNYENKVADTIQNPFEAFLDFNNSPTLKATKEIISKAGQLFDRNKLVAALTGCTIGATLTPNLATAQESFIRTIGSNEPLKTKVIIEQPKNPPVPKTVLSTNNQPNKKTEIKQTPSTPPSQLTKEQFQVLQKITNSYSRQEIQELIDDLRLRKVIAPDGNVNLFFLQNYLGESNYAKYFTPQNALNAVSKNKAPTINPPIDKSQPPLSFEGLQAASKGLSKSIARENNDIDPSFVWNIGLGLSYLVSFGVIGYMFDKGLKEKTAPKRAHKLRLKPLEYARRMFESKEMTSSRSMHIALDDILKNGINVINIEGEKQTVRIKDLSNRDYLRFLLKFDKYWRSNGVSVAVVHNATNMIENVYADFEVANIETSIVNKDEPNINQIQNQKLKAFITDTLVNRQFTLNKGSEKITISFGLLKMEDFEQIIALMQIKYCNSSDDLVIGIYLLTKAYLADYDMSVQTSKILNIKC
jgi:hypothetical protein